MGGFVIKKNEGIKEKIRIKYVNLKKKCRKIIREEEKGENIK